MNIFNLVMKKSDFFKHSSEIVATNLSINDGQVFFKTDHITKKYLDDNKISYKEEKDFRKSFAKKILINLNLLLFFIIFLMILYINSYRVSFIRFNGVFPINDEIEEKIRNKYTHFLWFDFIDVDYDFLSKELRNSFTDYEWISVYKDGTSIIVNINNTQDIKNSEDKTNNEIIASKDGVIESFRVYQGISKIKNNQYVKKGDLLITNDSSTGARGIVLASTYEEITIEIEKEEHQVKESGNISKYNLFELFGHIFSTKKKTKFENYSSEKKLKFNFFNFFKIYQIEDKEIYDIIETNSLEDAKEKASKIIEQSFNENKTVSEEKIEKMIFLYHEEDDYSFKLRFLVKKLESIGAYKEKEM